jgi:hypothetical protein
MMLSCILVTRQNHIVFFVFTSSPCALTENHAKKVYWGAEVQLHAFLTSAIDGGEWSASRPYRFTPTERAPGTHWYPRAGLDAVVKRKIPSPCQDSNAR